MTNAEKARARTEEQRREAEAEPHQEPGNDLLQTWADFSDQAFTPRNPVIHELGRGEIGILAAVTNRGKSTLLRLIAILLACGRSFSPLVKEGPPRRVWLLDWETPKQILQADLRKMQELLTPKEQRLVRENLAITCDVMVEEEPFMLTRPDHLKLVKLQAEKYGAEMLIIDTLSAAYEVRNENDNSEVGARIMKPTMRLARELNVAILLAHHIGKAGSEEGNAKEKAHLMRGASNFSGFASLVVNLLKGPSDDTSILSLAKVKGQSFDDVQLKLDRGTRWFTSSATAPSKPKSSYEHLLEVFAEDREYKRAEIEAVLAGKYKTSAITNAISDAVKSRAIKAVRRGVFRKATSAEQATLAGMAKMADEK